MNLQIAEPRLTWHMLTDGVSPDDEAKSDPSDDADVNVLRLDLRSYSGMDLGIDRIIFYSFGSTQIKLNRERQAFDPVKRILSQTNDLFGMSKRELFDMLTQMGREQNEESVVISEFEAEDILDESW